LKTAGRPQICSAAAGRTPATTRLHRILFVPTNSANAAYKVLRPVRQKIANGEFGSRVADTDLCAYAAHRRERPRHYGASSTVFFVASPTSSSVPGSRLK
jgi:hypothetical protein